MSTMVERVARAIYEALAIAWYAVFDAALSEEEGE